MKNDPIVVRIYGALLPLYPRNFRDRYGADMVQLVRSSCNDEPAWRIAFRVLLDLATSIPTQHLEARMKTPSQPVIPLIYTAVAFAGFALAAAGGTNVGMTAFGLVVAALAGTTAFISWRRLAPTGRSVPTELWWKCVLAGPILIGSVVVGASFGVEAWEAGMLVALLGLVSTVTGLLLGLLRLTSRRPGVI